MGAGVGHGAAAQIFHEIFQLRAAERVVGFHGVAADGLGHGVFAEPRKVHLAAGGAQLVHQIKHEAARVRHFDERRQRIEQEGAFAKFIQADSEFGQRGKLFAQKLGVARWQLDGFREQ